MRLARRAAWTGCSGSRPFGASERFDRGPMFEGLGVRRGGEVDGFFASGRRPSEGLRVVLGPSFA